MFRLSITLSDERHRALKEAAARRRTSIAALIDESLEAYGIRTTASAAELVSRARSHSAMAEDEAQSLANSETRSRRRR